MPHGNAIASTAPFRSYLHTTLTARAISKLSGDISVLEIWLVLTGAFTVPKIRQSPAQNTIESTLSDADSEKAEPIREKELRTYH